MKLNLIAPINKLSYGYVSVNILSELIKKGHHVSLFPIGQEQVEFHHTPLVQRAKDNVNTFSPLSPTLIIWHQYGLKEMKKFPGYHWGMPIFELDRFTQKDAEGINSMDELIVNSEWAKTVVERYTFKPTKVAPLGVDPILFKQNNDDKYNKELKFLNIGKWEVRKHADLYRIFENFHKPDISLTLCCYNPFISSIENEAWERKFKNLPIKVEIIKERLDKHEDIVSLMKSHDVGIFPSKAEGFNLPLLEMMSLGKSCIATECTAHTEFCNKENCYLIPSDGLEDAYDGSFFFGAGRWHKFKQEDLNAIIGKVYDDWKNQSLIKPVGIFEKFNWSNTADKILQIMSKK